MSSNDGACQPRTSLLEIVPSRHRQVVQALLSDVPSGLGSHFFERHHLVETNPSGRKACIVADGLKELIRRFPRHDGDGLSGQYTTCRHSTGQLASCPSEPPLLDMLAPGGT